MTTLRKDIEYELGDKGETWADVVHCTIPEEALDKPHREAFGWYDFTVWTHRHVYTTYSDEWGKNLTCALRNPPVP